MELKGRVMLQKKSFFCSNRFEMNLEMDSKKIIHPRAIRDTVDRCGRDSHK